MPISVSCPHCKARMTTSRRSCGRTVRCPKCSEAFQIDPAASPIDITEFDEDVRPTHRRSQLTTKERWLWGTGAAFILFSLISLTSFPIALAFPFLLIAGLSLLPPIWLYAEEWWAAAENHPIAIRAGLVMLAVAVCGLLASFSGDRESDLPANAPQREVASTDDRQTRKGMNAPQDRHKPPANSRTSAVVLEARVVPFQSPTPNVGRIQEVITTWKNTGTTPIRAIEAKFTFRNAAQQIIGTNDYTLYAEFDSAPGVLPGATYTTPAGQGFKFSPKLRGEAASVDVTIKSVKEHSGI